MPKIHIERSKTIQAPVEKVYQSLTDFNDWVKWSPWLIMEPGVEVNVSDDAHYYDWKGNRVGEGNMQLLDSKENESISYDLNFLKPWKSHAKVDFYLSSSGKETTVTWSMDSSLPFFMFWMKTMMEGYVGMDYERGLNLLQDFMEDGEIHSKLDFRGESQFDGVIYVGIKTTCPLKDLGERMSADFKALESFMKEHEALHGGKTFSIYHDWNMKKKTATYTSCVAVTEAPSGLSAGLFVGNIPSTKVYTVRHIGPYQHLGNAWSTLMNMKQQKEFKAVKGIHPFEEYINNPNEVEPNDLITDIHFAIK